MGKLFFYTNVLLLLAVMVCYVVNDVNGQVAEVYFGLFQLIAAVFLKSYTLFYNEKTIKKHLSVYWLLVVIFIIIFKTAISSSHNTTIVFIFIYPMFIAIYFTYITYLFTKKHTHHELQHP